MRSGLHLPGNIRCIHAALLHEASRPYMMSADARRDRLPVPSSPGLLIHIAKCPLICNMNPDRSHPCFVLLRIRNNPSEPSHLYPSAHNNLMLETAGLMVLDERRTRQLRRSTASEADVIQAGFRRGYHACSISSKAADMMDGRLGTTV